MPEHYKKIKNLIGEIKTVEKKKKKLKKKWREKNPTGKKIDCHRDTKIDPKTIRKWW